VAIWEAGWVTIHRPILETMVVVMVAMGQMPINHFEIHKLNFKRVLKK
jgi:hypothetical protein